MSARIQYTKVAPGIFQAMLGRERYLHGCGLETPLLRAEGRRGRCDRRKTSRLAR